MAGLNYISIEEHNENEVERLNVRITWLEDKLEEVQEELEELHAELEEVQEELEELQEKRK